MSNQPHLLLVEDERAIREPLARFLERAGYRVSGAADAAIARQLLPAAAFDLAVLDIMMPGEDGLSLARFIRASGSLPIILLTARAEEIDRIIGLEMGADDYLVKPFNPRELVARIRAVLRRSQLPATQPVGDKPAGYRFEAFLLDTRARLLRRDTEEIDLPAGEYRLLLALVERPGRVLTRDQLLDLVQGRRGEPFDRSIDNAVMRLRRRIELDPAAPRLIRTVHGSGYVFAAEVQRL